MIRRYRPDGPRRSLDELRAEIIENNPGEPWVGDAAERDWAEFVVHFAREKVAKATVPGFQRFALNWLLIYNNWPLPNVNLVKAGQTALPMLQGAGVFATFDRVFVLDSERVCAFDPVACRHHRVQ